MQLGSHVGTWLLQATDALLQAQSSGTITSVAAVLQVMNACLEAEVE